MTNTRLFQHIKTAGFAALILWACLPADSYTFLPGQTEVDSDEVNT
jgi:hypothetical protein